MGVRVGLNLVALFGVLAQPIIPDAAKKILDAMNIPEVNRTWRFGDFTEIGTPLNALPIGLKYPHRLFCLRKSKRKILKVGRSDLAVRASST